MSYGKKVQKAKAARSDHRKARAVAGSINRTALKRDSKKFKSLEREHDQDQRFGGSLKAVYFDSDGDGYKDTYGRIYRSGAVGKPGVEVPTFGPISAPSSGPSGLSASISIPLSGPNGLSATINIPLAGPSGLTASPEAPAEGPSSLVAGVESPGSGPSNLAAGVAAPGSGPSNLVAGVESPVAGPSGLSASINAPEAGPSGLSAEVLTLNIEIVSDQSFADSPGLIDGEIKYSSDVEYLFIYDSAEGVWHRTDGGNS